MSWGLTLRTHTDEMGSKTPIADAGRVLGFAVRQLESVAESGFGQDICGFCRILLDLLSKLIDDDVQVFHLVAIIWPPNRLQDFAMRNGDVWVGNQVPKNLKLLRRKADVVPLDRHMT